MTVTNGSGQRRFFDDFLLPRRPSSSTFVSKEYFFDESSTSLPALNMELHEVMNARVSCFSHSQALAD